MPSRSREDGTTASTAVRAAYTASLRARQHWHGLDARFRDGDLYNEAHAELQETTLNWFEALQPYMTDAKGAVREFWERAPLWPTQPKMREVLECPSCGAIYEVEDPSQVGDPTCVNDVMVEHEGPDGELSVESQQCGAQVGVSEIPETDDQGRQLYHWAQGLRLLTEWEGETEVVTEEVGTFKPTTRTVERPQRIQPQHLLRIARYLDQVAERKDLLAETKEETPTAKLDLQTEVDV